MGGWMGAWASGWMGGWTNGWMHGERMGGWMQGSNDDSVSRDGGTSWLLKKHLDLGR